jgi:hypothetical protein
MRARTHTHTHTHTRTNVCSIQIGREFTVPLLFTYCGCLYVHALWRGTLAHWHTGTRHTGVHTVKYLSKLRA